LAAVTGWGLGELLDLEAEELAAWLDALISMRDRGTMHDTD